MASGADAEGVEGQGQGQGEAEGGGEPQPQNELTEAEMEELQEMIDDEQRLANSVQHMQQVFLPGSIF